jgi:hypothetical protein
MGMSIFARGTSLPACHCIHKPCASALFAASAFLFCIATFVPLLAGQVPSHSSGWVVISVDAYRSLRAKAYPIERQAPGSPVAATLTRVDYDLRIDGELATGRAAITVDVLKEGWVRVPIPVGLLVGEAKLEGRLISLVTEQEGKVGGQRCALLSRVGRSVLSLDVALPIASAAGQESFALPATTSGITRASVQVPRQGMEVTIKGGLLSEKAEAAPDSKWVAYGLGDEPLIFTWRRKTEDHHLTQELRARGSLIELLGLGEESTAISAEVKLEIVQGAAREARIQVPEEVIVNQVLGAMVADWEMKNGQLAVTFLEPLESSTRFVVTGEARSPRDGLIDIPLLRLVNLERDTGGIAVEVLGAGEIKDVKVVGLENADASDLGELVAGRESPSLAAFKFRPSVGATQRSLAVNVARYTPQAVLMANVEEARYQVLASKDGKALIQARYAVRNNQRNFLKITLPTGASLWSASLSGKPIRPGQSPDGSVLLPLEKARAGEDAPPFVVEIVYLSREAAWTEKGRVKMPLPALDLPVSRTGLVIFYPPFFKVTPEQGAFRVGSFEEPSSSVLNVSGDLVGGIAGTPSPLAAPKPPELNVDADTGKQLANQAVLDKFRAKSQSGKVAGILPIRVTFPAIGPFIYMVSELTPENQTPAADVSYQREKKAGGK